MFDQLLLFWLAEGETIDGQRPQDSFEPGLVHAEGKAGDDPLDLQMFGIRMPIWDQVADIP